MLYPHLTDCRWIITVKPESKVRLLFAFLETQEGADFISVKYKLRVLVIFELKTLIWIQFMFPYRCLMGRPYIQKCCWLNRGRFQLLSLLTLLQIKCWLGLHQMLTHPFLVSLLFIYLCDVKSYGVKKKIDGVTSYNWIFKRIKKCMSNFYEGERTQWVNKKNTLERTHNKRRKYLMCQSTFYYLA